MNALSRLRHRMGTRWRMTLWVLLIVFVVTAVFGILALKLVERRLTNSIDDDMRETAQAAVAVTRVLEPEELQEIVDEVDFEGITSSPEALLILDESRVHLSLPAGSSEDPTPLPDLTDHSVTELRRRAGEVFTIDGRDGVPDYRVLTAQLDDGRLVVVATPLDGLERALQTIGNVLLFVALIGSGVMIVVVSFVSGYVTRPIDGMIATAEGIGSGALHQRIPVEGVDDVARLSSALNTMLDRLEAAFADKEASEAKLRQFVADASHELRTPLSAVLGYAELIETKMASTPEQVDHAVGRIAAEGERMRLLVEELLMLARLDHGRPANPVPFDVAAVALVAVEDARAIAPDRAVSFHRGEGDLEVVADVASVRQAIDNLIANSRAHTPDGTHVDVRVERSGADTVVTVDDDGPGIDPADLGHVFDRFYRAEKSRARPGGSGLGLSIVAAVARAHGGTVSADRSPAGGARFTLALPAAPPPEDTAPGPNSLEAGRGG